jgi:hypothetical protein
MGKQIAKLGAICVVGALALASVAGAVYKPPPVNGGTVTTKQAAKSVARQLQGKTGAQLAKGITIRVHFPRAGKIVCSVKGGGEKLASGTVTATRHGNKLLKVTFNEAGQTFLKTGAGKKVVVTCTFKPKKGTSSTSQSTVTLG